MNTKHKKTLAAIFDEPTKSNVVWRDIESLFNAIGAQISEGNGSRMRVELNEQSATFHRPHPRPETGRGALRNVRKFLDNAGVTPED